jgi:cytochrome c-type biogenesis protein CcmE
VNQRYIIGGIIILLFIGLAIFSFNDKKVGYADIETAAKTGEMVQVSGIWLKDLQTEYNSERNEFVFHLKDDNGTETKVVYGGAKPNNFELADKVVIKGVYEEGYFKASQILTKCPSKYEGKEEDLYQTKLTKE